MLSMARDRMAKPSDVDPKLGPAVAKARKRMGISQEELARRAGYARTMILQVESGRANLSLAGLRAVAAALGVRPEVLLK